MKLLIDLFAWIVPMNWMSRLTGRFAQIKFPPTFQRQLNHLFVSFFGINMGEAERDLTTYPCVQDVFTRRLKSGARNIKKPICSPADGQVTQSAEILSAKTAISAKGHDYSTAELVWAKDEAPQGTPEPGWYHVVYLAPHNYHRVHSPISGNIKKIRHIPGELWSVSPRLIRYIPQLFCRNERVVFEIVDQNQEIVYVVMVGAFNVGTISTAFAPGFLSNRAGQKSSEIIPKSGAIDCGQELGIFHLGSTVVTIFPKSYQKQHSFVQCSQNTPILMGQSIIR